MKRITDLPELNFFFFGFLLHFVWEMLQIRWFEGMANASHQEATWMCARATLGDANITVVCYWTIALLRGRRWFSAPTRVQLTQYIAVGILITIAFETLSTKLWSRWEYSAAMPVVPVIDVGLVPLLQWIVLPPLVLWIVRRQLDS